MSWELLAGIAVALLIGGGLVWIFAGRWVSASKQGAVAKDDLGEAEAIVEAQRQQSEVMAQPTPAGKTLLARIRARREAAAKRAAWERGKE